MKKRDDSLWRAAAAYELYRRHCGGKREDGTDMPAWNDLTPSAQFGCTYLVNVAHNWSRPASTGD